MLVWVTSIITSGFSQTECESQLLFAWSADSCLICRWAEQTKKNLKLNLISRRNWWYALNLISWIDGLWGQSPFSKSFLRTCGLLYEAIFTSHWLSDKCCSCTCHHPHQTIWTGWAGKIRTLIWRAWKGCGLTVNVGMKLGDFPSSEIQTAWTVMCFLICFDNIHFSESWHLGAVPYYLIGFRNDFISQENVIKTANWFVRLICRERHDGFLTTGRERVAGLHTSFKQVLRFFSLFLPFQNVEHILVCAGST